MPDSSQRHDVTSLLIEWRQGDAEALERLIPLIYGELRRLARAQMRHEEPGHSLQPTALVHEVYLRLVNVNRLTVESRAHFMAVAARVMRQILVDRARRKHAGKRGGTMTVLSVDGLSPQAAKTDPIDVDVLALHEALDELATQDARLGRIVEMRFFAGLTIEETAEALDVSTATVDREWTLAKAWLYERLFAGTITT